MIRSLGFVLLVLAPGLAAAQPTPRHAAQPTPRQKGDLAIQARAILNEFCSSCHGEPNRSQTRFKALAHESLLASTPVKFVAGKDPAASQLMHFLEDGSMPPAGHPRPNADQIAVIKKWIEAESPAYPRAWDEAYVLNQILRDVKSHDTRDLKKYRYVSFAHLLEGNGTAAKESPALGKSPVRAAENAAAQAITASQGQPGEYLVPIDPAATIFRLDIAALAWDTPDLFHDMAVPTQPGVAPILPFDLLLLEYPYAERLPTEHELNRVYLAHVKQLVPVPYIRGDWLGQVLAHKTPLCNELLALKQLGAALREGKPAPTGPDPEPFKSARSMTYPQAAGSRSIPPLGALGLQHIKGDPAVLQTSPPTLINTETDQETNTFAGEAHFKIKLASKESASFQVLQVDPDGEIRVIPVQNGDRLEGGKTRAVWPRGEGGSKSTFRLINDSDEDKSYAYLVFLTPVKQEIPVPMVMASRHAANKIWRFYHPASENFDPGLVTRYFLPCKVTRKK